MGQTVELLENALRVWEDMCLVDEARIRTGIASGLHKPDEYYGPTRHWRELRNHLLMLKGGDFDVKRFLASGAQATDPLRLVGKDNLFHSFPLQLASWTLSSRRVFHLSAEMIERFSVADYSHYKRSDLL